jgi:hypothetical protein
MTALQELLSERQRYEGWLAALEQRKTSTPPHVYERVRADYVQRLEGVSTRLAERTEQVRETIELLTSKLDTLRAKESDRSDARQEAELRAAVGEYSDEEWDRIREDADQELGQLAQERRTLEAELSEMQSIIESSAAPSVATDGVVGPSGSVTQGDGTSASPVASASSVGASSAPSTTTSAAAAGSSGSGRLSLNDFVADWPAKSVDPAASTPKTVTPQSATAQGDGTPRVREVDTVNSVGAPTPQSEGTPRYAQAAAASDTPVDHRRDNEKTLKCPECGAMNYATEWYCERCGGELATF